MFNNTGVEHVVSNIILNNNRWLVKSKTHPKLKHYIRIFPTDITNHDV